MRRASGLVAVLTLGALPALAAAQALPPTHVTIPKVASAPRLDDYLPGGSTPGLKIEDFRQRQPKDLEPVSQTTTAWLAYDAQNVYAAFACAQPKADIRARMQKREDIGEDDFVGIYLDTFHDKQRGYLFFASPIGVQADGIINETSGEDLSFDTQWSAQGRIAGDGFVVLITIPFKSLRFPGRRERRAGVGRLAGAADPLEQREQLLAGQHGAGQRLHQPVGGGGRGRRRLAGA